MNATILVSTTREDVIALMLEIANGTTTLSTARKHSDALTSRLLFLSFRATYHREEPAVKEIAQTCGSWETVKGAWSNGKSLANHLMFGGMIVAEEGKPFTLGNRTDVMMLDGNDLPALLNHTARDTSFSTLIKRFRASTSKPRAAKNNSDPQVDAVSRLLSVGDHHMILPVWAGLDAETLVAKLKKTNPDKLAQLVAEGEAIEAKAAEIAAAHAAAAAESKRVEDFDRFCTSVADMDAGDFAKLAAAVDARRDAGRKPVKLRAVAG